jgi:hypothetical protein
VFGSKWRLRTTCHNDVDLQLDQVGREAAKHVEQVQVALSGW